MDSVALMDWIWEHFYVPKDGRPLGVYCKRCDKPVFETTRHAREAHGDVDVPDSPSLASAVSWDRWRETFGPDTAGLGGA